MKLLPKDKLLHIAAGIVAGCAALALSFLTMHRMVPWTATVLAAAAGAGKEAWDGYQNKKARTAAAAHNVELVIEPHTVDVWDLIATLGGGVLVSVGATLAMGGP